MHICILLQSRHEIGPSFFHGAIGRRERLKQGVVVARNGALFVQKRGALRAGTGRPMKKMVDSVVKSEGAKVAVVSSKPFESRRGNPELL